MLTKKHKYKNNVRSAWLVSISMSSKSLKSCQQKRRKRDANEVRFHREVGASLVLSKDGGISVDMAAMKCRRSGGYEKETNYKVPLATNNLAG